MEFIQTNRVYSDRRNHTRQVGLEREKLQIHHQRQVIFEDRRRAQRLLQSRKPMLPCCSAI